ncbi:hypothetical protein LQ954_12620 [Sphingomonas sp. IC-11]|uniref:hypothetical protein n=1 Tax=Sphingomonas sp. IC-11 TaxID=2898528 RepID=UPI001E38E00E|nr:hypothetical protein [Sphingomonas sp. IC-11]MCD2316992.1 hypothetical protein [Sphingomonas sp. IC-11]
MTRAAARPLWLATPSRYAGRSRLHARWLLALLALLLLVSLASPGNPGSAAVSAGSADQPTEILYDGIVEDIRHGADYYSAAAQALRSAGAPMHPFFAIRLPTLSVAQAHLGQVTSALILYVLAVLTLFGWWNRLRAALPARRVRIVAVLLAATGVASAILGQLVATHDLWAGLIIALSLVSRRPGHWVTAAALGLSAALIRETAALYAIIMMILALLEGQRREATGWAAVLVIFAVIVAFHAQAVAGIVGPLDQPSPAWAGAAGFGFAIHAIVAATAWSLIPAAIGALVVTLSIAGWSAWRDPLATRALATIAAQLLLMSFLGASDKVHCAFLIAPIVPVGMVFLPDALRDLSRAALDRRRITVTRTAA